MLNYLRHLLTRAFATKTTRPRTVRLHLENLEERRVPTITYHGGALLPNVEVQGIYYGSQWSSDSTSNQMTGQMDGYLKYLVNSPYMDMLTNAGYGVGRGSFTPGRIYNKAINTAFYVDDSTIRGDLQNLIDNPANGVATPDGDRLYVVFVQANAAVEFTPHGENSQKDFLGYHSSFAGTDANGHSMSIRYAVITYPGGTVGNAGETGYSAFDTMTVVASHEITEAVTDPDPYAPGGWYDQTADPKTGQEVGDLAAHQIVYFNGYAVQKEANKNDQAMTPSKYSSTSILVASSSSLTAGDSVTLTVHVSGYGTPSGQVSFYDDGTFLGSATLSPNFADSGLDAIGQLTVPNLAAGSHSITASFGGDGNNANGSSSAVTVTVKSVTAGTTTTLQTDAATANPGQVLTLTATVGTTGNPPTGTVTFFDGGKVLGTASLRTVNRTAQATFTTTLVGAGAHSLTAAYGGDSAHTGSTSNQLLETVLVPNPGSGQAARDTVANELTHGAEYYGDFVTAAYQKYLGRAPEASGLAYWVDLMQHGLSDERLEAGFIGSVEYIQNHGGTGPNWVHGLYVDLLGRTPGASEVAYWVNNLNNSMSPADIAFGFAASPERESQRVAADYQHYLGRSASPTELPYWVNVFLAGADNERVIAGFVSSQEYFQGHGGDITTWLVASFQATLNRTPDASTVQSLLGQLK